MRLTWIFPMVLIPVVPWWNDPAGAAVIVVPDDHPTIQAAIDASAAHDLIEVRPGTYAEFLVVHDHDLWIRSLGGPDVTFLEQGDPDRSILLVYGSAIGRDTVIEGFTFQHVHTRSFGAIHTQAPIEIRGNVFRDNHAFQYLEDVGYSGGWGGAIAAFAPVVVDGNVFVQNSAGYSGGALFVDIGFEHLDPATEITRNVFAGGSSEQGAAVLVEAHPGYTHPVRFVENVVAWHHAESSVVAIAAHATITGNVIVGHELIDPAPLLTCHVYEHLRESEAGDDWVHEGGCNVIHDPWGIEYWTPCRALDPATTYDLVPDFCDPYGGDFRLNPNSEVGALDCGPLGIGLGCGILALDAAGTDRGHPIAVVGAHPHRAGERIRIRVEAPDRTPVRIDAFDAAGRRIATVREVLRGGEVSWRPSPPRAGALFLRVTTPDWTATRRLVLVP